MLSNQRVYVTLMVGTVVAIPVSKEILDLLIGIEVKTETGSASGFQLTFALEKNSPLQTLFLLPSSSPIPLIPPMVRVIIVITINGLQEVLMDGVITNIDVDPGGNGRNATLTVTGEDLSRVMDYIDLSGFPFPAMPEEARVPVMLAKYGPLGIVPKVIPSVLINVPLPTEQIPQQRGTDLAYINSLAEQVGYVFYISPGPLPGQSFAYWGPEIKFGVPQPFLNVDMDAHTNVDSLSFSFDSTPRTLPVIFTLNPETKALLPIPIPDITPLNPPLGALNPLPTKIKYGEEVSKYSPVKAAAIGLAQASQFAESVSATGSLQVPRYGRLLKARQLVSVRGAGTAFDGLYYTQSVTTSLKRGELTQSFKLTRNGLVPTIPKIP